MSPPKRGILNYGHVSLNIDQCTLGFDGEEIELSPTEAKLLAILMERTPRVTPPELLCSLLWPDGGGDWSALAEALGGLRSKLEKSGAGCAIIEVSPFGHRLEIEQRRTPVMVHDST